MMPSGRETIRWFLLICRICDPPLTMPFVSAQARGRWAAEHRAGTGHDAWDVWEAEQDLGQPETF